MEIWIKNVSKNVQIGTWKYKQYKKIPTTI